MIDLKSILIGEERVIGLQIKLPFTIFIFIFNSKGFLCGNSINLNYLYNEACICKVSKCSNYEECLNSEVIECNESASNSGIKIGMSGKDALLKMYEG